MKEMYVVGDWKYNKELKNYSAKVFGPMDDTTIVINNNGVLMAEHQVLMQGSVIKAVAKKLEELDGYFKITSVSRSDLEERGFDTSNVTDDQMRKLADDMSDDYLEQMFWESMDILAEDVIGIPKKNKK